MSRRTSAASLPTELLLRIFELVPMMYAGEVREDLVAWTVTSSCPDLPKVARVCRGWRRAAQLSLFHSVSLIRRKQVVGFIETASARPDLAQRVSALHIGLVRGMAEHSEPYAQQVELSDRLTEALALCVNVRHLLVNQMRLGDTYRFIDVLERLPLVSLALKMYDPGTDGLDSAVLTVPSDVYRAFSLPHLRNFELNFRPTWAREANYVFANLESRVENMSVTVNAPRGLTPMLSAAGPSLVRLNIYTEHVLDPDLAIAAFSTLVNLREFRLESTVAAPTPRLPAAATLDGGRTHGAGAGTVAGAGAGDRNDWLEALLPLYTKLQRLSISEQAASAGFLRLLPASVEVAEYISWDARPDSVLEQLEGVLRDPRCALRVPELVLAVDEEAFEGTVDDDVLAGVTGAFAARGVGFRVAFEPMEIPQLRWVDM
ncbi:hypothetical protein JCM9279_004868 [Rhodotorula babjevae]